MTKSLGFIDFAAVKAAVSLELILEHYGVLSTLTPSGSSLRGCCPIHKGSNPKQFSATLSKNAWNCFSECGHGGNQLDFVMKMEDCTLAEAAWKLNECFNLGYEKQAAERVRPARKEKSEPNHQASLKAEAAKAESKPKPVEAKEPRTEETGNNPVLGFSLENLDGTHPYLTSVRGLSLETIAHFGIGYCAKGILAGRIAIPIHNGEGRLVANAGRWPGEPPEGKEKYRLPGKFKKTLEVFNLHRAGAEPGDVPLVIVEGFFPVMHLWQNGVRRVVSLMGWFMSNWQEELISELVTPGSRIILMLDNDDTGNAARQKIAPQLAEHCFVRFFRWPEGLLQPDALSEEQFESLKS